MNEVQVSLSKPETLKAFSVELKEYIVSQKLYTPIQGHNYVSVEGWAFAGASLGLVPVVESCDRLEREGEVAYKASVAVYQGDKVVSRGIAICSDQESKRKNADEYVIASMAQTRATGKAYRLLLGWLMKMAGYESTPSEEMTNEMVRPEVPKFMSDSVGEVCPDCNGQMTMRKNGKGSYCRFKYPRSNPACPPTPLSEVDERIINELDSIPIIK